MLQERMSPGATFKWTDSVWYGWLLAVASTIAFSLVTPLGKAAVTLGIEPSLLLLWRYGLAALLLAISLRLADPARLRLDRRGVLITGIIGLANGLGSLTFFLSLQRIDASVATLIFSLNPIVVLGVLALRGEKLTRRHLVRLILATCGAYLLLGISSHVDWLGALLAFGNVIGFAVELALIQWYLKAYDTRTITLYVLGWMALVAAVSWLLQGAPWSNPGRQGWLLVGVLVTVGTYFGWWAMFTGIHRIGSGQVALLMPVETVLAVLWSFLFLDERFTLFQAAGGALILLSALLAVERLRRVAWRPRWRAWLR